jgi:DNA-binding NtrC family response regulator
MNETQTVLAVDDTPDNISVLVDTLGSEGCRVLVATNGKEALEQAAYAQPDLILLDVVMPGLDGFETCRRMKSGDATRDIPIIFMTVLDNLTDKILGFELGAVDYITKPFRHEEVIARVDTHLRMRRLQAELTSMNTELELRVAQRTADLQSALKKLEQMKNRLQQENKYLQSEISENFEFRGIVGDSRALRDVLAKVDMVAPSMTTVLICGETGTGKELIARAIHERSQRSHVPMVKLNCSAMSAGLIESELFGHVKGAFTGATDRRIGRFELADGGTFFLDEVSELSLEAQVKLLRVLQEREFEPVGSARTVRVDVRVIAATNRDLRADVDAGRFRADLYYRLNVFPIEVPPLRRRREDIQMLAAHFLDRSARRIGKTFKGIPPDVLDRLRLHDWPGNIRDLQNTIERAAILSVAPNFRIDWDLSQGILPVQENGKDVPTEVSTLESVERWHIINVLRQTGGTIEGARGAAQILGLKPSTARFRIRKLGISRSEFA